MDAMDGTAVRENLVSQESPDLWVHEDWTDCPVSRASKDHRDCQDTRVHQEKREIAVI